MEEKCYLSEKVAKYVLSSGTKNFRTSVETDLDVARPLLQSMYQQAGNSIVVDVLIALLKQIDITKYGII